MKKTNWTKEISRRGHSFIKHPERVTLVIFVCLFASIGIKHLFLSHATSVPAGSMPLISRNLPAFSNGNLSAFTPAQANNNDYNEYGGTNYGFVSATAFSQSGSNDAWISYNLSSVPAVQNGQLHKIYTTWYDAPINDYDAGLNGATSASFGDPRNYKIQVACEPATVTTASAVPTADWTTPVTVTDNFLSSRSHIINMQVSNATCKNNYNWIKMDITKLDGYYQNNVYNSWANAQFKWDIWDASQSSDQSFLFYGDSITNLEAYNTQFGAGTAPSGSASPGANLYGGFNNLTPSQQINQWNSSYFPSMEDAGIGGKTAQQYDDWSSNIFQPWNKSNSSTTPTICNTDVTCAEYTPYQTTLSSPLSTGGSTVTTLQIAALPADLGPGTFLAVSSGGNTQTWTLSAGASLGSTSLSVNGQVPNFAYPTGSTVTAYLNSVPWLPKSPAHYVVIALGTNDCNGDNFNPGAFKVNDRSTWSLAVYKYYDNLTDLIKQAMTGPVEASTAPGDPSHSYLSSRVVIMPTLPASPALRNGTNTIGHLYNGSSYTTGSMTGNGNGPVCSQIIQKVVADERANTVNQQYLINGATVVSAGPYDASSFGSRVINGPDIWADTDDSAMTDGTAGSGGWDTSALPANYSAPVMYWGDGLHPGGVAQGSGYVRDTWAQWIEANTLNPAAPVNTTLPTISGTTKLGSTLTATSGSWTNSPTIYAYQWKDCDSAGASCVPISGATNSTYTLQASDVSHTMVVAVTATSSGNQSSPASSAPTSVVGNGSQPLTGDINGDSSVNITDLSLLLSSYGNTTTQCITNTAYVCDLSSPPDGVVNIFDLSILLSHYGT
jgi:hypothetical protein